MTIHSPGLSRQELNDSVQRRFELKCGEPDAQGCIPWLAGKTRGGYGYLRFAGAGTKTTAHRIAWVLKRGDIPPEILVLHRCDNPSCVNAEHLFLGLPKDNTSDMVAKKRHGWRDGQPWQKLNAMDGERIRQLRLAGHTQQEIADVFGVSRPLISLILSGRIKHSEPLSGQ
jgi:hypothetical protein